MLTEFVIDKPLPANTGSAMRRWSCLLLAGIVVGLLFYLGAMPFAVGLFPEPWDKLAHFIVFGGLGVLLSNGTGGRMPFLVIGLVAGIGALDEWHQAYLPGRSADYADFLTDVLAASLAVGFLKIRDFLS